MRRRSKIKVAKVPTVSKKIIVLQINGPDKPGLFTRLCRQIADYQVNVLEISQNVLRGFLSITFLLDISELIINIDRFKLEIQKLGRELEITTKFHDYQEGKRPKIRNLYIFTFMGQDKPGILADLSLILSQYEVNIEEIEMRVKGNWIFNLLILDIDETIEFFKLRHDLRKKCEGLGLSMVLQTEKIYRKNKRLIVFDMDSTIIAGETIVEIAKKVNKHKEMYVATENAMKNNLDFEKSLRERVSLIEGVSLDSLYEVADGLEITPGMEELVFHLKNMGWKIAVVSSGFSIFTDVIKKKLELDYAFGNTLEISDNAATGKILGTVIDGKEKWDLVKELGSQLGISDEEIVTVGDGSNDQEMLKHSGLGIGLNSKEIASEVADGRIASRDVNMILLLLGMSDTEIESIIRDKK